MSFKLKYLMICASVLTLTASCNNKKKGGTPVANGPTEEELEIERQRLLAEQQAGQNRFGLRLNGQNQGAVIRVTSLNLNSAGGLKLSVTTPPQSLDIAIVDAPLGLNLVAGPTPTEFLISGQLAQASQFNITFLARDLTTCGTAASCRLTKDAQGRASNVAFNATYDGRATFIIDARSASIGGVPPTVNPGPGTQPNPNVTPTPTPNPQPGQPGSSIWSQLWRNPITTVTNGIKSVWDYLMGLVF